jgi:hypothetical protein
MECAIFQARLWYKYGDDLYGFDLDRVFVDAFRVLLQQAVRS